MKSMKKILMKGKKIKDGDDKYVDKDEIYDKKMIKKDAKCMKTAGIANKLNKAEKEMGYSKKPKVKPMKKGK